MYFIITKNKSFELRNKDISQYFGDAAYHCVPPTFRTYKLYIIFGFNIILKKITILSYILIPNETVNTYIVLFKHLKNNFGFNSKIFTIDFNIAE